MNVIYTPQPRKAHGAMPAKPFQHHKQVKRNRHEISTEQTVKMSPWAHTMSVSKDVDEVRTNWKGILYVQQQYGMFDPKPRLRKR